MDIYYLNVLFLVYEMSTKLMLLIKLYTFFKGNLSKRWFDCANVLYWQVARVLLLIYRLIVHPNTSRANIFAQSFISRGVVEALLVLLQREAKSGDNIILHSCNVAQNANLWNGSSKLTNKDLELSASGEANSKDHQIQSVQHHEPISHEVVTGLGSTSKWCLLKGQFLKNLGGIDVPNISDNVENSVYNIDNGDGVLVGIVHVLGALVASGHLTTSSTVRPKLPSVFLTTSNGEGNTMFEDRVSLLLFALQKAFQAAPRRLMTRNVYRALISSVVLVFFRCFICSYV